MNQFDDILRKKLEQEKILVNPGHLSSFESMLDQRNRKRRRALPWILGLLAIGLVSSLFLWKPWGAKKQSAHILNDAMTASMADVPVGVVKTEQNLTEILPQTKVTPQTIHDVKIATTNEAGTSSLSTRSVNHSQPIQPKLQTKNESILISRNTISEQIKEPMISQKEMIDPKSNKIESNTNTKSETPLFKRSSPDHSTQIFATSYEENTVPRKRDLSLSLAVAMIPGVQSAIIRDSSAQVLEIPIPSHFLRVKPLRRNIIGLISSVGHPHQSFDNDISKAYQFQLGGYLQRRISDRINLGLNGGFLYNRGGIDFSKTSAVEQYGFGLRSTVNTLHLKKAFFVFGGVDMQYRIKRHIITGGVQAKYLYGAQGAIARFVEDDFGMKEEELLDNIWLETEGLRKYSVDGIVGYGYQLSPHFSLFIQARLPLINTAIDRNQELYQDDYFIESSTQKVIPELSIRYTIFRF